MAKARRNDTVRLLGFVRRNRPALMMSTALQATAMLVLSLPGHAQPAPNARPTGGGVVAGSAAISQTSSNTQINQSSQRAAIDWRSFDVGSQQSVTFSQPSASAVALNRVTGPDPSQIAGRIDANGQIILVNQSGVNFYKGAQVNAAGVMVSTANISNANLMAGKLAFDQPGNPNAKIDNKGNITLKQAGLAAFVAPQVANSGTISAKLGHVVLAGAKTATLDLYGDGLLSLDVTNQVTRAPVGADGKAVTALVTNTGVIVADGGTVQLTARAADGIVQNLVQAGGRIRAATMGDHAGTIALNGVGGSIVVEGQLSAPGWSPGTKGGAIEIVADHDATVASTATVSASGKAGGGVVAIGTTLARARGGSSVTPALTAANTAIQPGAKVRANATGSGDGGRVVAQSNLSTAVGGAISAKGGADGGDGGFVETSTGGMGFALAATPDLSAPRGARGTWLIDPFDLTLSDTPPAGSAPITLPAPSGGTQTIPATDPPASGVAWLALANLNSARANVDIRTTNDLLIANSGPTANAIALGSNSLSLTAGHNISIDRGITIASGPLTMSSGTAGGIVFGTTIGSSPGVVTAATPAIQVNTSSISLNAGSVGIALGDTRFGTAVTPVTTLSLAVTGGGVSQAASGAILTANLQTAASGVSGNVSLIGSSNAVFNLGPFAVTGGDFQLVNAGFLNVSGAVGANNIILTAAGPIGVAGTVTAAGSVSLDAGGALTTSAPISATAGSVSLDAGGALTTSAPISATAGDVTLRTTTGSMQIQDSVSVGSGTLAITSGADLVQAGTSSIFSFPLGTIQITATGNITQTGTARIFGDKVSISAGGKLQQDQNAIITTGTRGVNNTTTVTAGGDILQSDSGLIAATNALRVTAGGNMNQTGSAQVSSPNAAAVVSAGKNLTQSGSSSIMGNTLAISAGGNVGQSGNALLQAAGAVSVTAGGTIAQTGGSITGNTLTGSASSAALASSLNRINNLGPFATSSGLSLYDSVPLTVVGAVSTGSGNSIALRTDSLTISAPVTAPNGTVAIAPLTTTRGMSLDTTSSGMTLSLLQSDLNQINAGAVALGSLDGGANLLTASLTVNRPITLNGIASTLGLFASGQISEVGAGALTVATLTGKAGTNALLAGSNSINALSNFVATTGFTLVNTPGLSVTGAVNGGTDVTITDSGTLTVTGSVLGTTVNLTGSNIDIPGSVDGPTSVSLNATPGGITETGSLTTALLTGSAATSANLSGATPTANLISNLGPFTDTSGGFSLATAGPLTVASVVTTKGNISLQATGDLSVSNPVVAADGNIAMQTMDSLIVNSTVTSGGDVMLQAGQGLAVLANITASGDVALVSDGTNFFGFSVIGMLLNAVVRAGGTVFLDGPNLATPQSLGLGLGPAGLVQSNGANPLISIGCDCSFFGPPNSLQAIGGTVEIGPRLGHEGSHSLGSSGSSVNASTLIFGRAHDPFTGAAAVDQALTIDPTGPIGARTLDLEATGSITQTAPLLGLQTLIGNAGSLSLNNPGNQIAFLGPFKATSGSIDFADSIPLAINGALSAIKISVSASGAISLQSDIATGAAASGGGALFTVSPDTTGKGAFRAATSVLPLNGGAATMTVSMPSQGGTVDLTSLNGPSTDLVLDLHTADAAGQINVSNLNVIGFGGKVVFTDSTVRGLIGSAAAVAATSSPANNPDYRVNGCEIGVGCIVISPPLPPIVSLPPLLPLVLQQPNISAGVTVSSGVGTIVNELIENATIAAFQSSQQNNGRGLPFLYPMRDLASGPLRNRQEDPDLLLPNVSEKDY